MKRFYYQLKLTKYCGYVLAFLTGASFNTDNILHGLVLVAIIGVLLGLYNAVGALGKEVE